MNLSISLAVGGGVLGLLIWPGRAEELPAPAPVPGPPGPASQTAAGSSHAPIVSADGRYVTFVSGAPNLVPGDGNGRLDVFRRDRTDRRTVLVSVNAAGTAPGKGASPGAAMSADGRWIAFESSADDLVPDDTNGVSDVFLRDLAEGKTLLVSRAVAGAGSGAGPSTAAQISPDGRCVLFESLAGNLVPGDTNAWRDLFLFDRLSSTMERVSEPPDAATLLYYSGAASLSADGMRAAFVAAHLQADGTSPRGGDDAFVRDRRQGRTLWASVPKPGLTASVARGTRLASDGSVVAFLANARSIDVAEPPAVAVFYLRDLEAGVTRAVPAPVMGVALLAVGLQEPFLSADGSRAAWSSAGQVYVWDVATQQHLGASVAADGSGLAAGPSTAARISPDGRHVWFLSQATNLVAPPPPAGWQLYRRDLDAARTTLVSAAGPASADGDVIEWDAVVDSSVVAFESSAAGLLALDFNGESDVFVRDLAQEEFELVSVADESVPANGSQGGRLLPRQAYQVRTAFPVLPGALSVDGRRLAFLSSSHSGGDVELAGMSIHVADLEAGTNVATLRFPRTATRSTVTVQAPQLNADGRTLVFATSADGLVPGDTNGLPDVLWRNLDAGETTLVSEYGVAGRRLNVTVGEVALDQTGGMVAFARPVGEKGELWLRDPGQPSARLLATNGVFTSLSFSRDGRWLSVACSGALTKHNSAASVDLRNNCYLYDLVAGEFELLSQGGPYAHSGLPGITATTGETPVPSADARRVAYVGIGSKNGVRPVRFDILLRDRPAGRTLVLSAARDGSDASHGSSSPGISRDGRRVVFTSLATNLVEPGWTNVAENVFLRHVDEQYTTLISVNREGTGPGSAPSREAQLSPSGRFVVFRSAADNLVSGDTNGVADLFLRDVDAGTTYLIGRASDGSPPDGPAGAAIWSEDSRLVVFEHHAANLSPGDSGSGRDLFVLRLAGPDNDADGMDDDWELVYFDTLARDGAGDFDADGASDLGEFRAHTNPTQDQSVLRALTIQPVGQGTLTVIWKSVPGRRYAVQTRADARNQSWRTLAGTVVAGGDTGTMEVAHPEAIQQFYRVLALP